MTHEDLLELGFELRGVEEEDPFYKVAFTPPFKFGVSTLSGNLENGAFMLYANNTEYNCKEELKKVIEMVGSEIYKKK